MQQQPISKQPIMPETGLSEPNEQHAQVIEQLCRFGVESYTIDVRSCHRPYYTLYQCQPTDPSADYATLSVRRGPERHNGVDTAIIELSNATLETVKTDDYRVRVGVALPLAATTHSVNLKRYVKEKQILAEVPAAYVRSIMDHCVRLNGLPTATDIVNFCDHIGGCEIASIQWIQKGGTKTTHHIQVSETYYNDVLLSYDFEVSNDSNPHITKYRVRHQDKLCYAYVQFTILPGSEDATLYLNRVQRKNTQTGKYYCHRDRLVRVSAQYAELIARFIMESDGIPYVEKIQRYCKWLDDYADLFEVAELEL